jgi:hypothetical protein
MRIVKEIRLFKVRESVLWSKDLEKEKPETKGNTITMIDIPAHCVVRTNCYGLSVAMVKSMAETAKKSFPTIQDEDINIVQYGGDYYAGTFGIEFDHPDPRCSAAPNGWQPIHELERTK